MCLLQGRVRRGPVKGTLQVGLSAWTLHTPGWAAWPQSATEGLLQEQGPRLPYVLRNCLCLVQITPGMILPLPSAPTSAAAPCMELDLVASSTVLTQVRWGQNSGWSCPWMPRLLPTVSSFSISCSRLFPALGQPPPLGSPPPSPAHPLQGPSPGWPPDLASRRSWLPGTLHDHVI